jgi:hypothetical protein
MFLMLEGQTAVLGSGKLDVKDTLTLVQAMESSDLMSPEQNQFFLYPIKRLKTFMERNIIPTERVENSALITKLLAEGHEGLFLKGLDGAVRFHHNILQSSDLERQLTSLGADENFADLVAAEAKMMREIYEEVFMHKQFTGRSGIMYKYEGIGSIYWHQNSKFMLSMQEVFSQHAHESSAEVKELKEVYYRLRSGFGFGKGPKEWGAFPLEPHSHTPFGMPAQQPGMTGQVKEDILTRNAELGMFVANGTLTFDPALLRNNEFLSEASSFRYLSTSNTFEDIQLSAGSLAYTICRTPVVYHMSDATASITVFGKSGTELHRSDSLTLSLEWSQRLFAADPEIKSIQVNLPKNLMI